MKIRYAVPEDYEEVERILRQAQQMHVRLRPDVYHAGFVMIEREKFFQLAERGCVLVCQEGEAVIGVLCFTQTEITGGRKMPGKVLYIDFLAVLESHRGKGIGSALLQMARETARENGCGSVELQVDAANHAAIQMYRRAGFSEKTIKMCLKL